MGGWGAVEKVRAAGVIVEEVGAEDGRTESDWRSSKEVWVMHWLADSWGSLGLAEGAETAGVLSFVEGVWTTGGASGRFGCSEELRAPETVAANEGSKATGEVVSVEASAVKEVRTTVEV